MFWIGYNETLIVVRLRQAQSDCEYLKMMDQEINKHRYNGEDGFTLVETVVSMCLFLAVLIPLLVAVGNFMLDSRPTILRHATALAESEMNLVVLTQEFTQKETATDNFVIERTVETGARIVKVHVTVATVKEPQKIIAGLDKSIIVYK
jgi:hypothetical protein